MFQKIMVIYLIKYTNLLKFISTVINYAHCGGFQLPSESGYFFYMIILVELTSFLT
jgi:hypothetical protein